MIEIVLNLYISIIKLNLLKIHCSQAYLLITDQTGLLTKLCLKNVNLLAGPDKDHDKLLGRYQFDVLNRNTF